MAGSPRIETILPTAVGHPEEELLPVPDPTGDEPVVAVLALGGMTQFEIAIATEVFGLRRGEVLRHPAVGGRWYDLRVCAGQPGTALPGLGGTTVIVQHGLQTLEGADLVVVPLCANGPDAERQPLRQRAPEPVGEEVAGALRAAHERGATLMSYCSGAFALAEAGVLDGRRATTHWMYTDAFRRRFPRVELVEDVLYVDEGDVLTSAGSAAGLDLSLHYIRRQHGADVADLLARRMVVPPHRDGGQAQFVAPPSVDLSGTDFADVLHWITEHLEEELTIAELAAHASMSERSFARHFRQTTGTTPHRWITERRVDRARWLLETTELSVDRVAARSGLGSAANLRQRLRERLGVSPSAYRARFTRCC